MKKEIVNGLFASISINYIRYILNFFIRSVARGRND